jgi:hypothetical protein
LPPVAEAGKKHGNKRQHKRFARTPPANQPPCSFSKSTVRPVLLV